MYNDFLPSRSRENNIFFNFQNTQGLDVFSFDRPGLVLIIFEKSKLDSLPDTFLKYKNHFKNISIYDCGRLCSFEELNTILEFFKSKGILPFIVGSECEPISKYASLHQKNIYHFSNQIFYTNTDSAPVEQKYLGYQRHLCDYDDIMEIESYHQNSMSLGKLRTYGYMTEPVLRDCNLVIFNSNVIRASDCSENLECLPTGLNAEEICQIFRYLGTGTDLDAIFIDDTNLSFKSGHLIAEAFWYFAEGFNIRMNDHPSKNSDFSEFVVDSTEHGEFSFVKNNQSQRWWLKKQGVYNIHYLACAFEEYQLSIQNEIPERLQKFLM